MSSFVDPTPRLVANLERDFQKRVIVMVNWARSQGVPLVVISGVRTPAAQARLIRAGRTTAVRSRHLTGRAVDVQVLGFTTAQLPAAFWNWLGSVGEAVGLTWGGRFTRVDLNHFQAS